MSSLNYILILSTFIAIIFMALVYIKRDKNTIPVASIVIVLSIVSILATYMIKTPQLFYAIKSI
ncbi:MAG: hypothetical protein GX915_08555 [Clostridiales bacterium]|nr:hypothetical protein [Clostridiales bacterium]